LLAERALRIEQEIVRGSFSLRPLDDALLLEFHSRLCGDLLPEWAGRCRTTEVRVGNLHPPPPYRVPMLIRDYAAANLYGVETKRLNEQVKRNRDRFPEMKRPRRAQCSIAPRSCSHPRGGLIGEQQPPRKTPCGHFEQRWRSYA